MKKHLFFLFSILSVLIAGVPDVGAQWVRTNGPAINVHTNRTVAVLGASSNDIFAETNNDSLFFSSDGVTWSKITLPSSGQIRFFAASGTNLFAITSSGISLAMANDTAWISVNNGLSNVDVRSFVVSGGNLFAGTTSGGVFLSTNNGTSWTSANNGIPNSTVQALAAVGTTLLAGTQYGGVFSSTNNGKSWNAASNGLTSVGASAFGVNGSNVFAATVDKGVFVSTDQGANWTSANSGLSSNAVFTFVTSGANTFAATNSAGIFLTSDNGTSWSAVNTGLSNTNINGLVTISGIPFTVTDDGSVFTSGNNGSNWTSVNLGYDVNTFLTVQALLASGNDLYAGTTTNGVYRSTDDGDSWAAANSGMESAYVTGLAAIGSNLFAGTSANYNGPGPGVYRSTNNGSTWQEVYTSVWQYGSGYIAASDTNLFAAIDSSVFLSTDGGMNWAKKNQGLPGDNMGTLGVNGTSLFVATYGVYGSSDNGNNWTSANAGLPGGNSFAWVGTTVFTGTGDGVYFSTNDGASWLPVPQNSTANGIQSLKVIGGTHLLAGTSGALYLSNNSGVTWGKIGTGLPITVSAIDYGDSNVYLGTSDGVWRTEILGLSAVAERSPTLEEDAVQVFPNPSHTKTTITISPTESSPATITIVNLLGQEVTQLFNGELSAGEHSFTWDANGVAPGSYWCIAHMGEQVLRIALSVQR